MVRRPEEHRIHLGCWITMPGVIGRFFECEVQGMYGDSRLEKRWHPFLTVRFKWDAGIRNPQFQRRLRSRPERTVPFRYFKIQTSSPWRENT
jgi:hypothetical protein